MERERFDSCKDGKEIEREFSDFIARIFQHELDHLNGTVFLDRIDSNKELVTEKEYQRLISKAMEEMDLENEG